MGETSEVSEHHPRSTPSPFHAGLTPDDVVRAAVRLTAHNHLAGWSLRDLAAELGVAASVVYHHVGGKDLLSRRVVEAVLDGFAPPDAGLPWDAWFRALLHALRTPLAAHPGTAHWLVMHGPVLPDLLPVIDTGTRLLADAGAGDRTGHLYSVLLNTAVLTIAMGDERLRHDEDGPRDHGAMMREFDQLGTESPGVAILRAAVIDPYTHSAERSAAERARYYALVVETTIAGVTALLR